MSLMNKDPGENRGVPFVAGQYENVTYLADGTSVVEGSCVGNVGPEEAREMLADAHGTSPDNVIMTRVDGQPYDAPSARLGRTSVAFSSSRWRSSWNPGADPSQN